MEETSARVNLNGSVGRKMPMDGGAGGGLVERRGLSDVGSLQSSSTMMTF